MTTKADLLRNPYVRIVLASNAGRGVNLSPAEVISMSLDDAIERHAHHVCGEVGYLILADDVVKATAK